MVLGFKYPPVFATRWERKFFWGPLPSTYVPARASQDAVRRRSVRIGIDGSRTSGDGSWTPGEQDPWGLQPNTHAE